MEKMMIPFLIGTALSAVTVFADLLIKQASLKSLFSGWKSLLLGCTIYALTGVGWFFLMRKIKLSTLGVWYSISIVLLLTLTSVFFFKEKINSLEILGIILAIISLIIMARFA